MATQPSIRSAPAAEFRVWQDEVELRTTERLQFIDITALVAERVRRSGVTDGIVQVQSLHTTTAILVNENEPFLLEDFQAAFERWAPSDASYRHDDFTRRETPFGDAERRNGQAHARAALLGGSTSLAVANGAPRLGRWQTIFLVELDGAQKRTTSITVMGLAGVTKPREERPVLVAQTGLRGVS